ncbi:MAG: acyl carrier protein [Christensenellales bacterium]|jgi:acyl carrier protein
MEKKILETIALMLNKEPGTITLESDFIKDLNADSLDILEMLLKLEEEYQITIKDEDVPQIKTVNDLIKYIKDYK